MNTICNSALQVPLKNINSSVLMSLSTTEVLQLLKMGSPMILFVVALLIYVSFVNAGAPEMTCKDFVISITKRHVTGIDTCTKAMSFKDPKEAVQKMSCVLKCVLKKEGVLNNDDSFDTAAYEAFVDREIPPNLMNQGKIVYKKCVDAAVGLDPMEEMCRTYDPLLKCMLDALVDICKL